MPCSPLQKFRLTYLFTLAVFLELFCSSQHAFAQYPVILGQPKSVDVNFSNSGQVTSFSVLASNASGYQWQISYGGVTFQDISDPQTFDGFTTSTLIVKNIISTSGAFFRVKASNAEGTVYSKLALLSVSGYFKFTYAASAFSWVVPQGLNQIKVTMRGASGGKGGNDSSQPGAAGGLSKEYTGLIAVIPGTTITIAAGEQGGNGFTGTGTGGGAIGKNALGYKGGYGGASGASGSSGGGGGGGGASVMKVPQADGSTKTYVVAGGGGGGGAGLSGGGASPTIGTYVGSGTAGGNGGNCTGVDGGGGGAGGGGARGGIGALGATGDFGAPGGSMGKDQVNELSFVSSTSGNGFVAISYDNCSGIPPVIDVQPQALYAPTFSDQNLTIIAHPSVPNATLNYLWFKDGIETDFQPYSNIFPLNNLNTKDIGSYSVWVTQDGITCLTKSEIATVKIAPGPGYVGGNSRGNASAVSYNQALFGQKLNVAYQGGQERGDVALVEVDNQLNGYDNKQAFGGAKDRGDRSLLLLASDLNGADLQTANQGGTDRGDGSSIRNSLFLEGSNFQYVYTGGLERGDESDQTTAVGLNGAQLLLPTVTFLGGLDRGDWSEVSFANTLSGLNYNYPFNGGLDRGDISERKENTLLAGNNVSFIYQGADERGDINAYKSNQLMSGVLVPNIFMGAEDRGDYNFLLTELDLNGLKFTHYFGGEDRGDYTATFRNSLLSGSIVPNIFSGSDTRGDDNSEVTKLLFNGDTPAVLNFVYQGSEGRGDTSAWVNNLLLAGTTFEGIYSGSAERGDFQLYKGGILLSGSNAPTILLSYLGGKERGDSSFRNMLSGLGGQEVFKLYTGTQNRGDFSTVQFKLLFDGLDLNVPYLGGKERGDFSTKSEPQDLSGVLMNGLFFGGTNRGDVSLTTGITSINGSQLGYAFTGGTNRGDISALKIDQTLNGYSFGKFYFGGLNRGDASKAKVGLSLSGIVNGQLFMGGDKRGDVTSPIHVMSVKGQDLNVFFKGGFNRGDVSALISTMLIEKVDFNVTQPDCDLRTGALTVTFPLGTGISYTLDSVNYQTATNFSNLLAGNYRIQAKFTTGETSPWMSFVINTPPAIPDSIQMELQQPDCSNRKGAIAITTIQGVEYSLDGKTYQADGVFSDLNPGMYTVWAKNTAGCVRTELITIDTAPPVPVKPNAYVSQQPSCSQATGTITVATQTGLEYSVDGKNFQSNGVFNGLVAGTYQLVAKNLAGCISPALGLVINPQPDVPSQPVISAAGTGAICEGTSLILNSSAANGNQWYRDGELIPGATQNTYVASIAGNYTVTETNSLGCTSMASGVLAVQINPQPEAVINQGSKLAFSNCENSTLTLSAKIGAGYSYAWYLGTSAITNATQPNYMVRNAGNYTVKVTDANGCVSISELTKVIAPPSANAIITSVCIGQTIALSADASSFTNPAYQWLKDGQEIMGAIASTFSASTSGQFSVRVSDTAAGTSISCPIAITVHTLPQVNLLVSGGNNVCFGTPVTIEAAVSGTPQYTYQWKNGGLVIPQEKSRELAINESGSFSVKVSDANGCVGESSASVISINPTPATPKATILLQPDCVMAGGVIAIDTIPGYQYSIDGTNYFAQSTFNNLAAGTYHITAKNYTNCVSADTTLIITPQPITPAKPSFSIQQTSCDQATGSITIQSIAGLTYSIDQSSYSDQSQYTNLLAGTYVLNAKNADGCISADTTFTILPKPIKPLQPVYTVLQPDCSNLLGSIRAIASSGEWFTLDGSTYQSSGEFTALRAGSYNLRMRNSDGCVSDDLYVTILSEPVQALKPEIIDVVQPSCPNALGSITVETHPGETYSLDGFDYNNTSGVFTDVLPGDYTLTAKSSSGCVSLGTSVSISAASPLNAPTITKQVQNSANCTGTGTNFSVEINPKAQGLSYSWERSTDNGQTWTVIAQPNLDSGLLYSDFTTSTLQLSAAPASATNYQYRCVISNACATVYSAVGLLNPTPELPIISADGPLNFCPGGKVSLSTPAVSGIQYQWYLDGDPLGGATSNILTACQPGIYSLRVSIPNGCSNSAAVLSPSNVSLLVSINDLPSATITQGTQVAINSAGAVTLNANTGTGLNYQWYRDGVLISGANQASYSATLVGNYHVVVTNASACSTTSAITEVIAIPSASLNGSTAFCEGGSVSISYALTAGQTIQWKKNGAVIAGATSSTYVANTSGTYLAEVFTNAGVSLGNTSGVEVLVYPLPIATINNGISVAACQGEPIQLMGTGGTSYQWLLGSNPIFGATQSTYTPSQSGLYSFKVKDDTSCEAISAATSVQINVAPSAPTPAKTVEYVCVGSAIDLNVFNPAAQTGISYEWHTVRSNPNASNVVTTSIILSAPNSVNTYYLYAKDIVTECFSEASAPLDIMVYSSPTIPTINVPSMASFCEGQSLTLSSSSQQGNQWYINGNTISGATGNTYEVSTAGNYSVANTDANGCVSARSSSVAITKTVLPGLPTANVVHPTCNNAKGSITVAGTLHPTESYSIDGLNYQSSALFTNVLPGTYSLTIKNASGCISTATPVEVNAPPVTPVAPTASVVQPNCNQATGTISVDVFNINDVYSINGMPFQSSPIFSNLVAGSYSLSVKNTSGCVSPLSTFVVSVQPATPAAATVQIVQPDCTSSTGIVTVSGTLNPSDTYSLDGFNYQSSPVFNSVVPGTYQLRVQNAVGCIGPVTSVLVNMPPATPQAPLATVLHPTCSVATGTITVANATASYTYSLDGANYQSSTVFSNLPSGTYLLRAKNAFGCVSSVTDVVINSQPATPLAPMASVVQPTCTVATGTLLVTGNLVGTDVYSIDGVQYQSSSIFSNIASGTYSLTVKNSSGCVSAITTVTINQAPIVPTITGPILGSALVVANSTQVYTVAAAAGATQYAWILPAGWSGSSTSNTITVTVGNVGGTIQVLALSAGGCTSQTLNLVVGLDIDSDGDGKLNTLDLDDDNDGILDAQENEACTPANSICDTDGDGTPNALDADSDGDGISDVIESNGLDANADGQADGAVDSNGVPLSANGGLVPPDTDGDGQKDAYDLDSDGDGVSDADELRDGTSRTNPCSYVVASTTLVRSTYWNIQDCDADGLNNALELTAATDPFNPDTDGDGVKDGKELSDGTNPLDLCSFIPSSQSVLPSAAWNVADCDGDGLSNSEEKTGLNDPSTAGNPTGNITNPTKADTDGDGVNDADESRDGTNPNDSCSLNLASQTLAPSTAWSVADCDGDGVVNSAEKLDATNLADGCDFKLSSRTRVPSATWNAADCDGDGIGNGDDGVDDCDEDGLLNFLDSDACSVDIIVPKVFTPNGDGINDGIKPILIGIKQFVCFKVYNRWGNLVYESKDSGKAWNGDFRGAAQGTETFLWLCEGYDKDGKLIRKNGMITLIR